MKIDDILKKLVFELKKAYGQNFKYLLLYGSFARGEFKKDSDVDLLAVFDEVDDFWAELSKLEDIVYKITFEAGNNVVLSILPITYAKYKDGKTPFILNVKKKEKLVR